MTTALVSREFAARFGEAIRTAARSVGEAIELLSVPEDGAHLSAEQSDRIACAFMDRDIRFNEKLLPAYGKAMVSSRTLQWVHVTSSGAGQLPFIPSLDPDRVTITTSTGSNAEPVAQTGFTGLLMLARGFPGYIEGQRKHEWRPMRGTALPADLRGQTVVQIGVGAIGKTFARYARAFGLKVIGVRRSPREADDPVDEMHPPAMLPELLPRADWLVICCPLTKETRNLIDAAAFKRMRKGARLINIARGEIVDEAGLIEALKSGHLGGAALDAFVREPLPADSPFWDLPNVIVSPHNASASNGNEKRCAEMFIENYLHWRRGEPMFNVQRVA